MELPDKNQLPFSNSWAKDVVWGLLDAIVNKTEKRSRANGEFKIVDTESRFNGIAPLAYYVFDTAENQRANRNKMTALLYGNKRIVGDVVVIKENVINYIQQLYPERNAARTEYGVGLMSYLYAHELGHKYHRENSEAHSGPPITMLFALPQELRTQLVAKSLPRFLGHENVKEIESSPIAARLRFRQSYLSGDSDVIRKTYTNLTQSEAVKMGESEFTAHIAAMSYLGEYVERGKWPKEAANVRQEIAMSLLAINDVLAEQDPEMIKEFGRGVRWLETDGVSIEGTPLLLDRRRLETLHQKAKPVEICSIGTLDLQ
jgi:hypothetical protein